MDMSDATIEADPVEAFRARFKPNPALAWHTGVERECFIADRSGIIVPEAYRVINHIRNTGWHSKDPLPQAVRVDPGNAVGYELSACQIETRTEPCQTLTALKRELDWIDDGLRMSLEELDYKPLYAEFAPDTMSQEIYPDDRYPAIVAQMSPQKRLAACQVAGTHVHIGMPDQDTALRVYNRVIKWNGYLSKIGDNSGGRRIEAFKRVIFPQELEEYPTWNDLYAAAVKHNFDRDVHRWWAFIRLSVHGTIEFRMFGTTPSVMRILTWAEECRQLCSEAAGM